MKSARDLAQSAPSAAEYLHRDTLEAAEKRLAFLLRSISTMLAIAFFLQTAWLAWRPLSSDLLYQFARINAVFFLLLRIALAKIELPAKWANPVAAIASLMANLYALVDLQVSDSPWPTTQLLIVLLVAGFVFASRAWFTALLIISGSGWFAIAFPHLSDDAWVQLGGALLLTMIWSMWFLEMRLRSFSDFERKVAEEEFQRVVEETRFFTKTAKASEPWCPICKASPDAVIRHNGEKIIDTNLAAEKLLGHTRNEFGGLALSGIFAPEKRDEAKTVVRSEHFETAETTAFRRDNVRVPVQMLNGGISKEPGGMMALVLRDASEQERARERVTAATQRAQQLLRRQADLAELAAMPDESGSLEEILKEIVASAQRALASTIGVFLILRENQKWTLAASSASGRLEIETRTDLAKKFAKPLIAPNLDDDPFKIRALYTPASVEAFATVPIIGANGPIGFLLDLEKEPHDFPPADIEFLTVLAHRAAAAMQIASFAG